MFVGAIQRWHPALLSPVWALGQDAAAWLCSQLHLGSRELGANTPTSCRVCIWAHHNHGIISCAMNLFWIESRIEVMVQLMWNQIMGNCIGFSLQCPLDPAKASSVINVRTTRSHLCLTCMLGVTTWSRLSIRARFDVKPVARTFSSNLYSFMSILSQRYAEIMSSKNCTRPWQKRQVLVLVLHIELPTCLMAGSLETCCLSHNRCNNITLH